MDRGDSLRDNLELLGQGLDLLGRLSDEDYSPGDRHASGIGAHVRHVLDHYAAFLEGWPTGLVDYDARRRETWLEAERQAAMNRVVEVIEALSRLDPACLGAALRVRADAGETSGGDDSSPSSVGRELQFLTSHTVHHWALIKMLLAPRGIAVGERFGVAPSTLRFWDRQGRIGEQAG